MILTLIVLALRVVTVQASSPVFGAFAYGGFNWRGNYSGNQQQSAIAEDRIPSEFSSQPQIRPSSMISVVCSPRLNKLISFYLKGFLGISSSPLFVPSFNILIDAENVMIGTVKLKSVIFLK